MTSVFIIGFSLGLFGSLHCIGMCGPLALAVPVPHQNILQKIGGTLQYNLGRILTYALLGLVLGLTGEGITGLFRGLQNKLSVIMGVFIFIYVFMPRTLAQRLPLAGMLNQWFEMLRSRLGQLFFKRNVHTLWIIGLLNGLLPCGMVYLALASSLASGTALKGMWFMTAFGVGTLPAMMSITLFGHLLPINIRRYANRMVPYFLVFLGALLVLRGLHLGIPLISPATPMDGAVQCHK